MIRLLLITLAICLPAIAVAAESHHSPEDQAIHERFYKTWMMPDMPSVSCCSDEDCSPAESRFTNGQWWVRKVGDPGDFTPVPDQKIEHNRDTPDGRSHVCGRRDIGVQNGPPSAFNIYCFLPGAGG